MKPIPSTPTFSALVQDYFSDRLIAQRDASGCTVAAYRDAFRLLLRFMQIRLHKPPVAITLDDLSSRLILAFLDYLEKERHNTVRTRNARLAALRSFLHYVAQREPALLANVQRVLAIPFKRHDRPMVGYLTRPEIQAVIEAPDPATWSGRRDRVMFEVFYNTGARVSEIVALNRADIGLGSRATALIRGKGRKERSLPLWSRTRSHIKDWLAEIPNDPAAALFPNRNGTRLTRSGIETRLSEAVAVARSHCATLRGRQISPHVLRHYSASRTITE